MTVALTASAETLRRFEAMRAAFDAEQEQSGPLAGSVQSILTDNDFRTAPNPYPGLRSFTAQEGSVFFGRERNVDEVRERLARLNFAVVLGGSGSGKSSLIRAGLIPRLNSTKSIPGRSGNWYAAEFRPRLRPLDELIASLVDLVGSQFPDQGPDGSGEAGRPDPSAVSERLRKEFGIANVVEESPKGRRARAEALCASLFSFVEDELNSRDRTATNGLRSGRPSLLLVVDQFEEVFRPEVTTRHDSGGRELLDLLIATYTRLERESKLSGERRSGLFVVITMRSEELHRCTEHPLLRLNCQGKIIGRSLADVVNGSVYLLDLLDPEEDRSDLREAIVGPAKRVFSDWGMPRDPDNPDAPFAAGVVDWLLEGAKKLSVELEHRPDQLPLLQHALQAIWHGAMDSWKRRDSHPVFEISKEHLQCGRRSQTPPGPCPDLAACLDSRANQMAREGIEQFTRVMGPALGAGETTASAVSSAASLSAGTELIRSSFRALAQRDDRGNWARRFADSRLIAEFLPSHAAVRDLPVKDRAQGIRTVLSSFVSRGYLVLKGEQYDISHEALIRNWKQYQEWLRDPDEIAQFLTRSVMDLDPKRIEESQNPEEELLGRLPPLVCETLAKVLKNHELPESWAADQVLPLMNRPGVADRWGSDDPAKIVSRLGALVNQAQSARTKRANERHRAERNRILTIAGLIIAALAACGAFLGWQSHEARRAAAISQAKSIALHAEDTLEHEGAAKAVLIALQAGKANLPNIPEGERVLYKSLHQLREQRRMLLGPLSAAAIRPKGDVIADLSPNGYVTFWRAADGGMLGDYWLPQVSGDVPTQTLGLQWSPDGEQFAIGTGDQIALVTPCSRPVLRPLFSSCKPGEEKDEIKWLGGPGETAGPGKFSKNGEFIITANWRTKARIWTVATGESTDLGVSSFFPWAVALAPDMRRAAVGTGQGEVQIIDLATKKSTPLKLPGHPGAIVSLDFGKDPDLLVVSTQSSQVWLLSISKEQPVASLRGQHGLAFQTAFSDDGKFVATAGTDGAIRLWRTAHITDEPDVLRGHDGPVNSIQFDHEGSSLVSASVDKTVRLWSVSSALRPRVEPAATPPVASSMNAEVPVARSEDGFTVKAYNGPNDAYLALFGPASSTEPVSVWGRRSNLTWRAVAIKPGHTADTGAVVSTLSNGETFFWTFFKKPEALGRFAQDHLPFEGDARVQLTEKELCRLELTGHEPCSRATDY
jgi:WD40 repeat protein